ncbi:uncharacterized protein PAE49_010327 [Odontesthes bonariensis]|uniref:uncharacterized protein LOC142388410 n=1 Tax=Odontesthes bonariensis TaxID=219752 RepID=UPI003F584F4E
MVQLIYPSLLLATIQLVSVSVGETPQGKLSITFPRDFNFTEKSCGKYFGRDGGFTVEMDFVRSENRVDTDLLLQVKNGYIWKPKEVYHIYRKKWYQFWYRNYISLRIPVPANNRSTVDIRFRDTTNQLNVSACADHAGDTSPQFYNESESWINAFKTCQKLNSDLVQFTNQTVLNEVKSLLKGQKGSQNGAWIGLERSIFGTNVKWKWISGSTAIDTPWNSSFPVNRLNNHCGKIVWVENTEEISLLDANCCERLPFICQGVK